MSKLWIVHRQAPLRVALARLAGVARDACIHGGPTDEVFATAEAPAAILIGFEGDFEHELAFLHRYDAKLARARRRVLVSSEDVSEVTRLAGTSERELVVGPPDPRALRDFVIGAVAHRNAEPLTARRERERLADRFAHWFGDLELPGLLRALDPALAPLPLLVRGAAGSGRGLTARYVERFRLHEAPGRLVRVDARDAEPTIALARAAPGLEEETGEGVSLATTYWIDDADRLTASAQRRLADWIRLGPPPGVAPGGAPRWIVTAGTRDAGDRLEPDLAAALAPLVIELPALASDSEATRAFAARVVADWATRFGGPARTLDASALEALDAIAWVGDRAGVEGALRTALARGGDATISAEDLADEGAAARAWRGATDSLPAPATPEADAERTDPAALFAQAPVVPPAARTADAGIDEPPGVDAAIEPVPVADPPLESPLATSPAVDELEQAFAEGALATSSAGAAPGNAVFPDGGRADGPASIAADEDPSRAMSEASLARAGIGDVSVPGSDHEPPALAEPADPGWRRLARSLSHEIRNPLVSIRTFTQLLPEHFEDAAFRERFTELVGRDVDHIDAVIDRLARAAEREKHEFAPVDVSAMIERLLDARRSEIGERRLLVLRELEREAPIAWADADALELALTGLLDRALASLPERGDLFVATRRIERGPDGGPRLRVLLRHHGPEIAATAAESVADATMAANAIEYVLAETIVGASGGQLTIDATDASETLILVDLKTPGRTAG